MRHLLCVVDAQPRLRLLTWALIEEGFKAEQCAPEMMLVRMAADPPDAVLLNCSTLTANALADLVGRALLLGEDLRVIILGEGETGGDTVRYVPAPYRIADVVREITDGKTGAVGAK